MTPPENPTNYRNSGLQRSRNIMKTILIVDSAPHHHEAFFNILAGPENAVISVRDENAALSVLKEGPPVHLVLLACRTDGHEGIDFLRLIRRSAPAVPAIMLTECGSIEVYLKALSLGVFEYLIKPIARKEFKRITYEALAKSPQAACEHLQASGIVLERTA